VLDPTIVSRLMQRRRPGSPLTHLTQRERDILTLMAEGRSNSGIAGELEISERTVEAASAQLFRKLGLDPPRREPSRTRRPQGYSAAEVRCGAST